MDTPETTETTETTDTGEAAAVPPGTEGCPAYTAPPPDRSSLSPSSFRAEELGDAVRQNGCLAVADLDADGWLDLVSGLETTRDDPAFLRVHWGSAAGFTAHTDVPTSRNAAVCLAGDDDGDGHNDLLLVHRDAVARISGFQTREPTTTTIASIPEGFTTYELFAAAGVDLNRDGRTDLVLSMGGEADICQVPTVNPDNPDDVILDNVQFSPGMVTCLLREPDGSFTATHDAPCPAALVAHDSSFPFEISLADLNEDRQPEILITGDFAQNTIVRSTPDGWEDWSIASGLGSYNHAMGVAWADFDRDGWRDLFIADYGPSQLQHNVRCDAFFDVAVRSGVADATRYSVAWAVTADDLDLDGDLFVTQHIEPPSDLFFRRSLCELSGLVEDTAPMVLLANNGRGRFTRPNVDLPITRTADENYLMQSTAADFDRDGDIDIVTCNRTIGLWVHWNEAERQGHWLSVSPQAADGQPAWGARVIVHHEGGWRRMKELWMTSGMTGMRPPDLHFGLGARDAVVDVEVHWPDGSVSRQDDVAVDQAVVVRP